MPSASDQAQCAQSGQQTESSPGSTSTPSGASVQRLRQSLRGRDFAEQESMLAPVQMDASSTPASVRRTNNDDEGRATLARLDAADDGSQTPGARADAQAPARDDSLHGTLARLDARDDGSETTMLDRMRADESTPLAFRDPSAIDPDAILPQEDPLGYQRGLRREAQQEANFHAALAEGDVASAMRHARGENAPVDGDLTQEDQAAVERMRAGPLSPAAERAAEEEEEEDDEPRFSGGVEDDGTVHGEFGGEAGAIGASVNALDGTASANARVGAEDGTHGAMDVRRDADGNYTGGAELQVGSSSGAHANAAIRADQRGRVTEAEIGAQSGRIGSRRVRYGGQLSYHAEFGEPALNASTHQYDVAVKLSMNVELTAAAKARLVDLSGEIGGDFEQRTVRSFATARAAQRWVDGEQPELDELVMTFLRGRLEPSAALALANGEQVEVTRGEHVELGAGAGVVSLKLRLERSSTWSYHRIDENRYQLGLRTVWGRTFTPGARTPILSTEFEIGHQERDGRILEFDLSTPEGQAALERALDARALPRGQAGAGWHVVETLHGTTDTNQQTIDTPIGQGTIASEDNTDVRTAADGTRDVSVHGSASIVGESGELTDMVGDLNDGEGTTRTGIAINDAGGDIAQDVTNEDAMSAQQNLAAATGTQWNAHEASRAQEGTWTAHAIYSDAQMVQLWRKLKRGDGRRHATILATRAHLVAQLEAAARAAPSAEEARPAVMHFVTQSGPQGAQFLRTLLGSNVDYDVTLEGSTVFEGAAGRERFEHEIGELELKFRQHPNDPALEGQARTKLREQQERVSQMSDGDAFALPPAVRQHELALNRPLLERARRLLQDIEATQRQRVTTRAQARSSEEMAGDALAEETHDGPQSSEASHEAAGSLEAESRGILASLRGDEQRMLQRRQRVVEFKAAVQREWHVHNSPMPSNGLIPTSFFTGVLGNADEAYASARHSQRAAETLLNDARDFYAEYENLKSGIPTAGLLDAVQQASAQHVRRACWRLATNYQSALEHLDEARQQLGHVRQLNPGVRFWGQTRLPPAP